MSFEDDMKKWGLGNWKLRPVKGHRRLGVAIRKSKTIGINYNLLRKPEEQRRTFIHECAHAKLMEMGKPCKPQHGNEWKRMARSMGMTNPTATDVVSYSGDHKTLYKPFRISCPQCREVYASGKYVGGPSVVRQRYKRMLTIGRCRNCSTSLSLEA